MQALTDDNRHQQRGLSLSPPSKMWRVLYAAIGVGLLAGIGLYLALFLSDGYVLMHLNIGLPIAAGVGLLLGLSYYFFFKLVLRAFTQSFLRQAQRLVTRPIDPLPSIWSSHEIDKLEEIMAEALATLQRLDLFSAIAKDIVATLDSQKTLERIAHTAVETLPADGGLLLLMDKEGQHYRLGASSLQSLSEAQRERIISTIEAGRGAWMAAADQQRCLITPNRPGENIPSTLQQAGVRSLLSAPLIVGNRPIGVLNLFSCQDSQAFNENDLRLLCIYADLAAVAIDNARQYQQTQRKHRKLSAILHGTAELIIVLDKLGRVLLLNPAVEACFEVQAQQIIGQPLSAIGVDDLTAALETARERAAPIAREVKGPDGLSLYASLSPVPDVGWVIVMQNITSLKELGALRTDWVATVSHDMKNPLTVIQMAAGLLHKTGPLNEKQHQSMERIQRSSQHLHSLVTDVLDLARLKAGPTLQMKPIHLADVIDEALAEIKPLVADREQGLVTDLPANLPVVNGDARLLARALVNLLSNASKYTPAGGQITVGACLQDAILQLRVTDTGRGIPAEAIPHLFDRFYRVPGFEEETNGTGLGLNIVKSIIEKHDGQICVDSTLQQGSTFTITLPYNAAMNKASV